ncbi:MAG: hypothetical protein IJ104_03005 [Methanobrevibacter sp.]|nr:hypothetical protein [Methanobrevibacter sp.]
MYTKQQQLDYLNKLHHLQKAYVIKDNIHLTYKSRNRNKAINKAHTLQDKIIDTVIDEAVFGNTSAVEVTPVVNELISEALTKEQKRINKTPSQYVETAVNNHINRYSEILNNRINIEASKLEVKIESEIASGIHNDLSEEQLRQELRAKYGETGKKRIQNIIKDSVHSQECNLSWIQALSEEYQYKIWCNGNRRGNTRAWHIAKYIDPVPIDEPFIIDGPYGVKESMFPGDLNSGAENVANCKCYLGYTNHRPKGLKQKSFNIPDTSYLNDNSDESFSFRFKQGIQNTQNRLSQVISTTRNSLKTKVTDVTSSIKNRFKLK